MWKTNFPLWLYNVSTFIAIAVLYNDLPCKLAHTRWHKLAYYLCTFCIRCTGNQVLGKTMLMMIDGNNSKRKRPIEKFLLLSYVAVSIQWCLKISYGTYILGVQNKYAHKSTLDKPTIFSCSFPSPCHIFRIIWLRQSVCIVLYPFFI